MKAGKVISLRVNPKDCMSCIDVLEKAGIPSQNMSFARVVSLALASALETFRTQKIIPERDGFEYADMMARFGGTWSGRHKQKLEVNRLVESVGSELKVQPVIEEEPEAAPMSTKQMRSKHAVANAAPPNLPDIDPIELKELTKEFNDLNSKKENKHIAGVSWSAGDEDRWQELYNKIFGF